MTGSPPPGSRRGRWVAIVTGAISVLVAVLYLLLIVVLDSRGPLQPPPPEALGLAPQHTGERPLSAPEVGGAAGDRGGAAVPPPG